MNKYEDPFEYSDEVEAYQRPKPQSKTAPQYSLEDFEKDVEDVSTFKAQIPPIDSTDMQLELGAMWNKVTKNGFRFFKGEIVDSKDQKHEITILPNGFKKKPTHPDWRIYWHKKAS